MIKIHVMQSYGMGTNCYVVSDGEKYIVIDPSVRYEKMDALCEGKICGVLLTHGHFDHIEQLRSYLDNTDVYVYGHLNCLEKLENPELNCSSFFGNELKFNVSKRFLEVKDNDELNIFSYPIKVNENLGHTNCSVSYTILENIFTGDFVFKGSIGRTDLPTGSNLIMRRSLEKFKLINEDYNIYPGHGDNTKLYIEKNRNPYL